MPLSEGDPCQHAIQAYSHILEAQKLLNDHDCRDIAVQLFGALGSIEQRFELATAEQIAREVGFAARH